MASTKQSPKAKSSSKKKKTSNPRITKPKSTPKSKKVSNPKITKKNPKRVKAGKKGWKTRSRKRQNASVKAVKRKAQILHDERVLAMSRDELIKELERTRARMIQLEQLNEVLKLTKDWVPYYDREQLHLGRKGHQSYPRGSIALRPSRARTLPISQLEEILRRMRKAHKQSEDDLDRVIYDVSDETGFSIREIYTLWFSP